MIIKKIFTIKSGIILTVFSLLLTYSYAEVEIAIEPPISSGLIVDPDKSYIEKLTLAPNIFPPREKMGLFWLMIDVFKDYTIPYTDHFPIIWQDQRSMLRVVDQSNKLYFNALRESDNNLINWETDSNEIYRLNLQWFDAEKNKFYQSEQLINTTKLYGLNKELFLEYSFDQLLIDLAEGGEYTLWLSSPDFKIQFSDHISAKKIEYDWEIFKQSLNFDELTHQSQDEYSNSIIKRETAPYYNLRFSLIDEDNDNSVSDYRYYVTGEEGQIYCGTTNAEGMTKTFVSDRSEAMNSYNDTSPCPRIRKEVYSINRTDLLLDYQHSELN